MTREQEFEHLVEPAKAWLAREEVALHEVLAAVLAMKEKGFLESVTGLRLDEEDRRLLTFCKFAEEHFLSEDTRTQLSNAKIMAAQEKSFILKMDEVQCSSAALTGGKGSSLAVLNSIVGIKVPNFFCVTTHAFYAHFALNKDAGNMLAKLQEISDRFWQDGAIKDQVQKELFDQAGQLRLCLEQQPLAKEISDAVRAAYQWMPRHEETGDPVFVAVRSSATTEDTKDASFAGQHDTFLFQKTIEDIETSIRHCWASIFTDRAVEYRGRNNIKHADAVMSVVVQEMVSPDVAGTAFSLEMSTGFPAIHIAASYGLGEAVVSGQVTSDEWLIHPANLKTIKRVRGSKKEMCVTEEGKSGTIWVPVPQPL